MIESIAAGFAATKIIAGPAEWAVHKYILHSKTRPNKFIEKSSIAHNDMHHFAYMAPQHYYRDTTNEDVTVHFGAKDVALIAAGGAAMGGAMSLIPGIGPAAAVGSMLGTVSAYGLYEFTHHYMHVIGERRLDIGRVFGDYAEGGNRSGELLLPKPTLDSLCSFVDDKLDGRKTSFPYSDNCKVVLAEQGITTDLDEMIGYTVGAMREKESEFAKTATKKEMRTYTVERKMNQILRRNGLFQRLDNHHFLHHKKFGKNLNVVWMWYDHVAGTKMDSSPELLMSHKKYWLCPNSPDVEKFSLDTKKK